MTGRCAAVAALTLLMPHNVAHGHHAFSPVYDASKTVTIKGTLTDFKLVNPHATMTVDVVDEAGKHVAWTVEMAGLLSLTRQGWTEKSITVGEQLTIIGNPTHTGSPRMAFDRLTRADGTELLDPGENNQGTIEEQRRERALQRQQK